MNMSVTQVDTGSVVVKAGTFVFDNDELTVPAETTIQAGTILARDSGSGLLVPFVSAGETDGEAYTVLTYDVTNDGEASAPIPVRYAVGEMLVYRNKLIIQADGDGSNVTQAVVDQLRVNNVAAVSSEDLTVYDNE